MNYLASTIYVLLCAALGFSTYEALAAHRTYTHALQKIAALERTVDDFQQIRYGIIESVDAAESTLTAKLVDQYTEGYATATYTFSPLTQVYRQELVEAEGIYRGYTPISPASLGDLSPGERVALIGGRQGETLYVYTIFFGNPL